MVRAVFPGTFDPIHFGHIDIARRASYLFDELIVAVFDRPMKNLLFSPEERISLVKRAFKNDAKIVVQGYSGLTTDFCRDVGAQVMVRGLRVFSDFELEFRLALANHHLAPNVEVIALITSQEHTFISSSIIREVASLGGDVNGMVPDFVKKALIRRYKELDEGQQAVRLTTDRE